MAEQSLISIEELEKAIIAVQRGEDPQVDLPPAVIHAIRAAMSQLGNFTPTPEFLQKLQHSLESRIKQQNPEITITLPVKYLKRGAASIAAVIFVAGIWLAYGEKLSLNAPAEPIRLATIQQTDNPLNTVSSNAASTSTEDTHDAPSDEEAAATEPVEDIKLTDIPALPELDATPAPTVSAKPSKVYSYLVRMAPKEYAKIRDTVFPVRITEYLPKEYWLELKPGEAAKLSKSIAFTPVKDPFQLFQREGYDDPLAGLPEVNPDLQSEITPESPTLFLMQYVAQTKKEWGEIITEKNAVIVGDDNDYRRVLVWATPEIANELASLDFIRWIGPLHPQYKVQEKLLSTKVPAFAVKAIFYAKNKAMLDQIKLAILDIGGVISSTGEKIEADHKVTLDVMITPDIVRDIITLPSVISVYAEKSREYQ